MQITRIEPIISNADEMFKGFITLAVNCFYCELEGYITHNNDPVILEYGNEATLMTLFVNGLIRHDGDKYSITSLQEYGTSRKSNGSNGRLDAFIRYGSTGIWIEAKYDKNGALIRDHTEHWDIDGWLKWDNDYILKQVEDYYKAEELQVNESYTAHYIMTLAFKKISASAESFRTEAVRELGRNANKEHERPWYYSVGFFERSQGSNEGLEVYGTYEKKK